MGERRAPSWIGAACVVYGWALRLLPRRLRGEHGPAMAALFRHLAEDAARRRGAGGVAGVLLRSAADVVVQAVGARWQDRAVGDPGREFHRASARRSNAMDSLWLDVKQAVRSLARRPGLAVLAVATFALGIGANTAIFSVVSGVLLRDLPYEEPDRIVRLLGTQDGAVDRGTLSYPDAWDVAERSRLLQSLSAYDEWRPNLTVGGEASLVDAALVNVTFFDVLGVRPAAGRFFIAEEDIDGRDLVVVLSHGTWQDRFGGDPSIVGRTVLLNGREHTVVGIAPADFEDPQLSGSRWGEPELWRPLGFGGLPDMDGPSRGGSSFVAIARLADGAAVEAANAELATIMRQLEREYPDTNEGDGMLAVPLAESIVGAARGSLLLLFGAVVLVLAIAAANVGNLLLGRATERRHEVALRAALGASRRRIVSLVVTETMLLALVGGVLGIVIAGSATGALVRLGEEFVPRGANVSLDTGVLAFAFGVTVLTGLLCGLVPALLATRADLRGALGDAGRRASPTRSTARLRRALVVAEVALALLLLTGAGLLGKSLWRLMREDLGIQTASLLTFDVAPAAAHYPDADAIAALHRDLSARIAALPDVRAVATTNLLPLSGGFDCNTVNVPGRPELPHADRVCPEVRTVDPSYFPTTGLGLRSGRLLDDGDRAGGAPVAVIGEALARAVWPGEDPVGRQIGVAGTVVTVVGVVGDVKHLRIEDAAPPTMYVARSQLVVPWHARQLTFVVAAERGPASLVSTVRSEVRAFDPLLPVANLRTMDEVVERSAAPPRFRTFLLGAFAALALVLASVGIYGVVSYSVAQRTREMAIRMAVGARAAEVRRMVVRQALAPVALGVAVGLAGAFALARVLAAVLFDVATTDAAIFTAVPALLGAVALMATLVPARRATRVDPMAVLREE